MGFRGFRSAERAGEHGILLALHTEVEKVLILCLEFFKHCSSEGISDTAFDMQQWKIAGASGGTKVILQGARPRFVWSLAAESHKSGFCHVTAWQNFLVGNVSLLKPNSNNFVCKQEPKQSLYNHNNINDLPQSWTALGTESLNNGRKSFAKNSASTQQNNKRGSFQSLKVKTSGFCGTDASSGGTEAVTTSEEEQRRRHGGGEVPARGASWSTAGPGKQTRARSSLRARSPAKCHSATCKCQGTPAVCPSPTPP